MSITTKRGDDGETDLMFGRRISKASPRVEAYGTVDELNSILGMVRHAGVSEMVINILDDAQARLVGLMGELATLEEDLGKYDAKGYVRLKQEDVEWLEKIGKDIEQDGSIRFKGWSRPGKEGSSGGAHLDWARSVCRRAERKLVALQANDDLSNVQSLLFLNRLSDVLWLLARHEATLLNEK